MPKTETKQASSLLFNCYIQEIISSIQAMPIEIRTRSLSMRQKSLDIRDMLHFSMYIDLFLDFVLLLADIGKL